MRIIVNEDPIFLFSQKAIYWAFFLKRTIFLRVLRDMEKEFEEVEE